MYSSLISLHSLWRWLVVLSLVFSIVLSFRGLFYRKPFQALANGIRHWTATIAHIQLMIGMALYVQSPYVRSPVSSGVCNLLNDQVFFRFIHITLMLVAVIFITIGSAKAKRMKYDRDKYQTMLLWFLAGFIVILLAIPWPFSPLSSRPYFRAF